MTKTKKIQTETNTYQSSPTREFSEQKKRHRITATPLYQTMKNKLNFSKIFFSMYSTLSKIIGLKYPVTETTIL